MIAICLSFDWSSSCHLSSSSVLSLRSFFIAFATLFLIKIAIRLHSTVVLTQFWNAHGFNLLHDPTTGVDASIPIPASRGGLEEMIGDFAELGDEAVVLNHSLQTGPVSRIAAMVHIAFVAWRCFSIRLWLDAPCDDCYQPMLRGLLSLTVAEFLFFLTYHIVIVVFDLSVLFITVSHASSIATSARLIDTQYIGFPLCEVLVDQLVVSHSRHVQEAIHRRRETLRARLLRERTVLGVELDNLNRSIDIMREQIDRIHQNTVASPPPRAREPQSSDHQRKPWL